MNYVEFEDVNGIVCSECRVNAIKKGRLLQCPKCKKTAPNRWLPRNKLIHGGPRGAAVTAKETFEKIKAGKS